MEKHLRNAPTYAVLVALIIQVTRVADFGERIGAGWLAWVYALFLALTIYALAYWVGRLEYKVTADPVTDKRSHSQQVRMERIYKRARVNSTLWLALFLCIDGGLNFAETMAALPVGVSTWEFGGAAIYGVFPTLAVFGLGSLQAMLDKIPSGASKAGPLAQLAGKLLARLDATTPQGDKQEEQVAQGLAQETPQDDKQEAQVAPVLAQARKQPMQDNDLLAYLTSNPQASDQQAADKFGVSRQAIQQRRRKMTERGAFMQSVEKEKVTQ